MLTASRSVGDAVLSRSRVLATRLQTSYIIPIQPNFIEFNLAMITNSLHFLIPSQCLLLIIFHTFLTLANLIILATPFVTGLHCISSCLHSNSCLMYVDCWARPWYPMEALCLKILQKLFTSRDYLNQLRYQSLYAAQISVYELDVNNPHNDVLRIL